jgi:hypothetical protein
MTSVLTDELIGRGQADQRQRDIDWLRFLAQKVAREPNLPIMGLPLIPTNTLERVADLLAEGPIGSAERVADLLAEGPIGSEGG